MAWEAHGEANEGFDDISATLAALRAAHERRYASMAIDIGRLGACPSQHEAGVEELKECVRMPLEQLGRSAGMNVNIHVQHQPVLDIEQVQCSSLGRKDVCHSAWARSYVMDFCKPWGELCVGSDPQVHVELAHNEMQQQGQASVETTQMPEDTSELTEQSFCSTGPTLCWQQDSLSLSCSMIDQSAFQEANVQTMQLQLHEQASELSRIREELRQLTHKCEILAVENRSCRESATICESSEKWRTPFTAYRPCEAQAEDKILRDISSRGDELLDELLRTCKAQNILDATEQGSLLETRRTVRVCNQSPEIPNKSL
jgi:uncharacterized coiled-coil protein SlyX